MAPFPTWAAAGLVITGLALAGIGLKAAAGMGWRAAALAVLAPLGVGTAVLGVLLLAVPGFFAGREYAVAPQGQVPPPAGTRAAEEDPRPAEAPVGEGPHLAVDAPPPAGAPPPTDAHPR